MNSAIFEPHVPRQGARRRHHSLLGLAVPIYLWARWLAPWVWTLLLPSPLFALTTHQRLDQLHHTAWTAKDGLTGAVQGMAQTTDGYLWIATTGGLFRFDGVLFERFHPESGSLPATSVSALLAVPGGGLWIGYDRGNASFLAADGRIVHYTEADGMPIGRLRSFARDESGYVWAGAVGGVVRLEGQRWQRVRENWNFPYKSAYRLFVDRAGTLWVAAASPDRIVFLPKNATAFQDTGLTTSAFGFTETADGAIALVQNTEDKVSLVRPAPGPKRTLEPIVNLPGVELDVDRDGSLWLSGFDIVRLRLPPAGSTAPAAVERFTQAQGLSGSISRFVFEDREGNIWVGTEGGLDRFRHRNITWDRHRDSSTFVSLVPGSGSDVWALSSWAPHLRNIQVPDRPVRGAPEQLAVGHRDVNGVIWLGGDEGLWRWHRGQFRAIPPPAAVIERRFPFAVIALTTDHSGRLWVSISGLGQFTYEDGVWTFVDVLPQRSDVTPFAAHTDAAGRVWLAYRDELAMIENGKVRVFSAADGLAVGPLHALTGRGHEVWVAGETGLAFLRGDRFQAIHPARAGGFTGVNGIVAPEGNGVWLGTASGILHIPEPEIQHAREFPSYRVDYELLDLISDLPEPLQPPGVRPYITAVEGGDGLLWFATNRGVARVDPQRRFRNTLPPPVTIRSLIADDRTYGTRRPASIPALTRTIRIDYTALSLAIPERVRFRFRLEGWETNWHEAGTRRSAFYTQLGPGEYRFRVVAANNDGVWNERGAEFVFTVAPAWYQTRWFKAGVGVSFSALVLGLYRYRVRRVAAALSQRFDARLAERTRIARDLHDTLLQTVQGSKMLADHALLDASDHPRLRNAMEQLSAWLDDAVREGRAALNSLRTSNVDAKDLVEELRRALDSPSRPAAMSVSLAVNGNSREVHPIVLDELLRVGGEAIRNAFNHSAATHLEIALEYEQHLTMRITDNGKGMDPVVSANGKPGHFGLPGMRERAASIGGYLTVHSSSAGTSIAMIVPGRIAFRHTSTGIFLSGP